MANGFKPNIYPIMYWGLLYGLVAGFVLILISILSRYITFVWFPVFLTGVIWGGLRNYQKQKREAGQTPRVGSPIDEFREAASDIVQATKDMIQDQAQAEEVFEEAEPEIVEPPSEPVRPPAIPIASPTPEVTVAPEVKPEENRPPEQN